MGDLTRIRAPETPTKIAITTTASAEQQVGTVLPGDYKFMPEGDVWIKFGGTGGITDPVVTSVAGASRCKKWPANQEQLVRIEKGTDYFKAITDTGTSYLSWELDEAR